jgi:hypothetical protein
MAAYSDLLPSRNLLFASDRLDRDLVRDFLFVFSRAEYALKACGFVSGRQNGDPIIEWKRLAHNLGNRLLEPVDAALDTAREYLLSYPPRKQSFTGLGLAWKERVRSADQSEAAFLMESVKQVRNNLFHGGKELMGRLAERDKVLVQSALLVIAFAISSHPDVRRAFCDAGPERAAA